MDYEDAADVFENISEGQIHVWRTLIELVKSNCILYQKKLKGYSKKIDKSLMWTNIGKLLVPPMTGIEAEKMFYRLRQKFGKERRKVIQSQARSGAGADHMPYKSDWILYDDLLFLADHIQPRRTTSNFQRPVHQGVPVSQTSQLAGSTPLTYSSATSDDSLEVWNVNLYESLTGSECTSDERLSCSAADSVASCSSASFTPTKSSPLPGNTSASMLKTMAATITPKKHTPSADIVKKRKRGSVDEMDTVMIESSKNISLLASTLEAALKTSTPALQQLPTSGWTPAVQGMMGSIALGLSKVPEECQMDCLISILSCINTFLRQPII